MKLLGVYYLTIKKLCFCELESQWVPGKPSKISELFIMSTEYDITSSATRGCSICNMKNLSNSGRKIKLSLLFVLHFLFHNLFVL